MAVCVFVLMFLLSSLIIHVITPSLAVSVDALIFFPLPWAYNIWNQSEPLHYILVAVVATCYPHSVFLTHFIIFLKFHCSNSLRETCPQIGTHEYIICS